MSLESDIQDRLRGLADRIGEQQAALDEIERNSGSFSADVEQFFAGTSVKTPKGPADKAMLEAMEALSDSISKNRRALELAAQKIEAVL